VSEPRWTRGGEGREQRLIYCNGLLVGIMDTPSFAKMVVDAMNDRDRGSIFTPQYMKKVYDDDA